MWPFCALTLFGHIRYQDWGSPRMLQEDDGLYRLSLHFCRSKCTFCEPGHTTSASVNPRQRTSNTNPGPKLIYELDWLWELVGTSLINPNLSSSTIRRYLGRNFFVRPKFFKFHIPYTHNIIIWKVYVWEGVLSVFMSVYLHPLCRKAVMRSIVRRDRRYTFDLYSYNGLHVSRWLTAFTLCHPRILITIKY